MQCAWQRTAASPRQALGKDVHRGVGRLALCPGLGTCFIKQGTKAIAVSSHNGELTPEHTIDRVRGIAHVQMLLVAALLASCAVCLEVIRSPASELCSRHT